VSPTTAKSASGLDRDDNEANDNTSSNGGDSSNVNAATQIPLPITTPLLLHGDDFYLSDSDIPIHKETGLQDWDCVEALNVPLLTETLKNVRDGGSVSEDFKSLELIPSDGNADGGGDGVHGMPSSAPMTLEPAVHVSQETLDRLRRRLELALVRMATLTPSSVATPISSTSSSTRIPAKTSTRPVRFCILDGFLLFTPPLPLDLMDIKLLLRASRSQAIARRANREGYVTLEGFWTDPPGYVEKVVWTHHARYHSVFFKDGDVEGEVDEEACRKAGLECFPSGALAAPPAVPGSTADKSHNAFTVTQGLEWVVERVAQYLETPST